MYIFGSRNSSRDFLPPKSCKDVKIQLLAEVQLTMVKDQKQISRNSLH